MNAGCSCYEKKTIHFRPGDIRKKPTLATQHTFDPKISGALQASHKEKKQTLLTPCTHHPVISGALQASHKEKKNF